MDSIRFMGILLLLYYFQIHLHHLLAHFHLEIVLCSGYTAFSAGKIRHADGNLLLICLLFCHIHHA